MTLILMPKKKILTSLQKRAYQIKEKYLIKYLIEYKKYTHLILPQFYAKKENT